MCSFLDDNFLLTVENDGLKETLQDELYKYATKYSLRHFKNNQSYTKEDIENCWDEFIGDVIPYNERIKIIEHYFKTHRLQIYGKGEDSDGYKLFKYYNTYSFGDDFKSVFSNVLNEPQTIAYKHLDQRIQKYIDEFNKVFFTSSDNIDFNLYASKDDDNVKGHITYSCFRNGMNNFIDIEVGDSKLIGRLKHRPFNEKERISEMKNLAGVDRYMPSSSDGDEDDGDEVVVIDGIVSYVSD